MVERLAWSRVAAAVVAAGVIGGACGAALTLVLHAVQHLAYGYATGPFLAGVEHGCRVRRVLAPALGGAATGAGWWWLRRAGWSPARPRGTAGTLGDALLQVSAVGAGLSLGREGAPRQAAGALTAVLARRMRLPQPHRATVAAAAAGAGLAAMYNVPASGALFAAGVLLDGAGTWELAACAAAAGIATVLAWPVVGTGAAYRAPHIAVNGGLVVWALAGTPLWAATGVGAAALLRTGGRGSPRSHAVLPAAVGSGGLLLGVLALWRPELLGNGKGIVQTALVGAAPVGVFAVLTLLKPLVTALGLATGARGGLMTPLLATGAGAGGALVAAGRMAGVHPPTAGLALTAAAATLGTAISAPVFAAVFMWELARPGPLLLAPMVVVCLVAHRLGRRWMPR